MRYRRIVTFLLLFSFLSLFVFANSVSALTVDEVAGGLICPCGCGKMLDVCEMESARQMRVLIGEMIDEGQDKDKISNYFVSQYGEKVLAAPSKKGFGLTAWVVPFIVIGLGVGIIYLVIVKWALRGKIEEEERKKPDQDQPEKKYTDKLKKELDEFKF